MNPLQNPAAYRTCLLHGTGVYLVRNTWMGSQPDVMVDDGFGNLVLADTQKAGLFLAQEA